MIIAAKRIVAFMLATSLQICGMGQGAAARPAKHQAAANRIVPTVEVLQKVRAAKQSKRRGYARYAPLPTSVHEFPIMTVNVEPAKPDDFVVTINKTHYKPGEREFRVVPGRISIIVTGRGKEPCKATLEVSDEGPNTIACQL